MPVYIVAKSITNVDWYWMLIDMLIDILIDADWYWLMLTDRAWCWLLLIDADWYWLMLIDADRCSNKVQPGFLLSERTSGASPVIFMLRALEAISCFSKSEAVSEYRAKPHHCWWWVANMGVTNILVFMLGNPISCHVLSIWLLDITHQEKGAFLFFVRKRWC